MRDENRAAHIGFLGTQHGGFLRRLRQYIRISEHVSIVTGYISLEGLGRIVRELSYPKSTRILVGVKDEQGERLRRVIGGEETGGEIGEYVRRLVRAGCLEIVFVEKARGCRLFHSKGYLFSLKEGGQFFICGSNNLTESGLVYNREWSMETDEFSTYCYAKESFEIEWALQKQDTSCVKDGEYRACILNAERGQSAKGGEYIEIVYKVYLGAGEKLYFLVVERIRVEGRNIAQSEYDTLSDVAGWYSDPQDIDELLTYLYSAQLSLSLKRTGKRGELKVRGRKYARF